MVVVVVRARPLANAVIWITARVSSTAIKSVVHYKYGGVSHLAHGSADVWLARILIGLLMHEA